MLNSSEITVNTFIQTPRLQQSLHARQNSLLSFGVSTQRSLVKSDENGNVDTMNLSIDDIIENREKIKKENSARKQKLNFVKKLKSIRDRIENILVRHRKRKVLKPEAPAAKLAREAKMRTTKVTE